ncbi:MAG: heavy metal-binding domain-containing protein [Acidimicrobiales bacterium]
MSGPASDWDGQGLPPAAAARVERARASGVRSSLLAVPAQAGLDAAGLSPVGEVMGCLVEHIGWQGYAGCGWMGGVGMGPLAGLGTSFQTLVAGPGSSFGFAPYVDALDAGWQGAIGRMLAECAALGGDGVVGVRLEEHHLGNGNREFVALGTGVRGRSGPRLRRPFATTLDGQDVAKLLHSHWVPAGIVVAITVGIRHDDYRTRQTSYYGAGNVEVPGFTDLVGRTREGVRQELSRRCAGVGADGAILTTPMWLSVHELEVSEGHTDHAAEAGAVATLVRHFGRRGERPARAPALPILPLR